MGISVTTGNFSDSYNPYFSDGVKWDTSPDGTLRVYAEERKLIAEFSSWTAVQVQEETIKAAEEPNG